MNYRKKNLPRELFLFLIELIKNRFFLFFFTILHSPGSTCTRESIRSSLLSGEFFQRDCSITRREWKWKKSQVIMVEFYIAIL